MTYALTIILVLALLPIAYLIWIGVCLLISRVLVLSFIFLILITLAVRGISGFMMLLVPRRFQELTAVLRTTNLITRWSVHEIKFFLHELRDLEALPTIKRGMQQLGIKSLMETFWRRDILHRRNPRLISPLQNPIIFVPGIPATPFYPATLYPWIADAVALLPQIQKELAAIQYSSSGFRPYQNEFGLNTHPFAKPTDGPTRKYEENDWNMYFFYRGGTEVSEHHAQCPVTSSFLKEIPELETTMVCFSALKPGIWIPPHYGLTNAIVRIHIPLVIPSDCMIRVGDQTRHWQPSVPLLFDDSFEHEVWNKSQYTRIVLFINAFHPNLESHERAMLAQFLNVSLARSPAVKAWRNFTSNNTPESK